MKGKVAGKWQNESALLILFFRWLSPLSPNGMALVGKIHKLFFFSSGLLGRDLSSEDIDFDCDTGRNKRLKALYVTDC